MTTTNGFAYKIKNDICTLMIPKTIGIHNIEVQKAKIEIFQNNEFYCKEIKILKK
jgi:hypothetical protein